MNVLLDIVGSSLVAGFILLIAANLNTRLSDFSTEFIATQSAQSEIASVTEILEYDFYKIGYRVNTDKILIADIDNLKFLTDAKNNGIIDTIRYYTESLIDTVDVDEYDYKILYRKINLQNASRISKIKNFSLSYYDSVGYKLNYSNLVNSNERKKIKSIELDIEVEFRNNRDASLNHISKLNKRMYPINL